MKKRLLFALALISVGSLNAQIIYTDIDPDTVLTGLEFPSTGDDYFLDLDNNGVDDFEFQKVTDPTPWDFGYIQSGGTTPGGNEVMAIPGDGIRDVLNLELEDPIGASGPWELVTGGNLLFLSVLPSAAIEDGLWVGDDDGYVGLRFDSSGTQCYGWARVGFSDDHKNMTIKEYAYRCDGLEILAGEIPEDPCEAPEDLTATAVTIDAVELGWTELNGATEWEVEYGLSGFGTGTGTSEITTSNPLSLTGLADDTGYDYYVRSICGIGDTSEWSVLGTFETVIDDAGFKNNTLVNLLVYPNPAKEVVNFEFNLNLSGQLTLYDVLGQEIQTVELFNQSTVQLNVSNLPSGRYIYQLSAREGFFNGQLLID